MIEVRNVGYSYPDGTVALDQVSLTIERREAVALVGQNGCGKTTLCKCLSGILKPTAGSVLVEGHNTGNREGSADRLAAQVGYVFQNPDHQLFSQDVYSEIAYGPRNLGLTEDLVSTRVAEAAAVAGIAREHFAAHPFFLPKGLRQRVAIASVLSMRPATIIVDEPTTGQDVRQSREVIRFLRGLAHEHRHAVVIVTHEMRMVADFADRVIVLDRGVVALDGPTRRIFSHEGRLQQASVEAPQITRLGGRLSKYGVRGDVLAVPELVTAVTERLR